MIRKNFLDFISGRRISSPVFLNDIKILRESFLSRGQNFEQSIIIGVGSRCKYGFVKVLICDSVFKNYRPFPTNFWLTCPFLIKFAGKIESHGGIKDFEKFLCKKNLKNEWLKYNRIHQVIRLKIMGEKRCFFMRKFKLRIFKRFIRGGIGGIKYNLTGQNINVKCLHLQTASFLALGFHPGEEWLLNKGLHCDCDDFLCIKN